jgi:hypothetical protein
MRFTLDGIPASPGIVIGTARVLRMDVPSVPHGAGIPSQRSSTRSTASVKRAPSYVNRSGVFS